MRDRGRGDGRRRSGERGRGGYTHTVRMQSTVLVGWQARPPRHHHPGLAPVPCRLMLAELRRQAEGGVIGTWNYSAGPITGSRLRTVCTTSGEHPHPKGGADSNCKAGWADCGLIRLRQRAQSSLRLVRFRVCTADALDRLHLPTPACLSSAGMRTGAGKRPPSSSATGN